MMMMLWARLMRWRRKFLKFLRLLVVNADFVEDVGDVPEVVLDAEAEENVDSSAGAAAVKDSFVGSLQTMAPPDVAAPQQNQRSALEL